MYLKTILALMINLNSIKIINDIKELKWSSRVLIIKNDKKGDFFLRINSLKQEFDERDVILVYVKEQNTFIHNKKMSKKFTQSLLKMIKNIDDNQNLILIGKDGKIKNSYSSINELEKIFSDVDKMPMRMYEMQMEKK
tara:strand:+ start:918 stop:1331 length:414 start_codon:yes stop_codon:yes gene_type:complete